MIYKMRLQNKRRPALELRRRFDAYQALASLLTLSLFFSPVSAVSFRQAFGGSFGLFQQAPQQSRDKASGGSDEKDVRALEAGKSIKGELAGGRRHAYRISLGANQFLKVVVEQQGIDIVAQVSGPDGKQILEFDSESRLQGREEVSLVAEAAGAFQLIVRPKQDGAPAGSYEIRIEELRVATDTDRALHDARKQFEEALKLQRAGKYDEALSLVERAFSFRLAFGDSIGLFQQAPQQSRDKASGGGDEKDVRALEAGKSIKGELAGGRRHAYRISLGANQFLKVVVEQQGIDIVAQVSGPDGKQILEFDSESRLQGREEVSLVAEAAGAFQLIVRPKQDGAPAGSYEIRIEELRVATDTDRALHDARKQFEEALKLQRAGKYDEALSLVERALEIRERLLGTEHRDVAAGIDSLAGVYSDRGEYVKAEPLYLRALAIREKALGIDHPDTATGASNLGKLYHSQGKYVEAEPLHQRALDIREKALGKDHPSTAQSLNNLAFVYEYLGKYAEAEPLYKRALDIREKSLGNDHPGTVIDLNCLSALYMAKGDLAQAVKFQSRANAGSERDLVANLVIGSERQKLAYLAILSDETDRILSLHLRYAPNDPAAGALAATMILQRKGRALDATSQNLNALRSRFNAEDQALLDRLTETRSQLARLVLGGPQKMTAEQYQARIKDLEDQADKDEADISRRSDEFRAQSLPVTLEAVRAAIPSDSALIEFASYRPFNAKATRGDEAYGQPRYVAYVLRHEGEIEWKELGEAKAIDTAIAALRKALRDPKRVDVKRLARAVDAKVFQPVRPLLGDVSRLLISPDGSLNLVP